MMKNCAICGNLFKPKTIRNRFCSKECAYVEIKTKAAMSYRKVVQDKKRCAYCANEYTPKNKASIYCTKSCSDKARQTKGHGPYVCIGCGISFMSKRKTRSSYCSRDCYINSIANPNNNMTEQQRQQERDRSKARRAKRKGAAIEAVSSIQVFERDDWTCHICRKRLSKENRGTIKPEAPEIDHIVPIAKGGKHSYANVACACRQCNMSKGAR